MKSIFANWREGEAWRAADKAFREMWLNPQSGYEIKQIYDERKAFFSPFKYACIPPFPIRG